jgi:hypothetical protein
MPQIPPPGEMGYPPAEAGEDASSLNQIAYGSFITSPNPLKQFPAQNLIIPEARLKSICFKEPICCENYNSTIIGLQLGAQSSPWICVKPPSSAFSQKTEEVQQHIQGRPSQVDRFALPDCHVSELQSLAGKGLILEQFYLLPLG